MIIPINMAIVFNIIILVEIDIEYTKNQLPSHIYRHQFLKIIFYQL